MKLEIDELILNKPIHEPFASKVIFSSRDYRIVHVPGHGYVAKLKDWSAPGSRDEEGIFFFHYSQAVVRLKNGEVFFQEPLNASSKVEPINSGAEYIHSKCVKGKAGVQRESSRVDVKGDTGGVPSRTIKASVGKRRKRKTASVCDSSCPEKVGKD